MPAPTASVPAVLSKDDLRQMEARHAKTTKGTWRKLASCAVVTSDDAGCHVHEQYTYGDEPAETRDRWNADADFIAHAHQDVPRLIDSYRALSARLDALTAYAKHERDLGYEAGYAAAEAEASALRQRVEELERAAKIDAATAGEAHARLNAARLDLKRRNSDLEAQVVAKDKVLRGVHAYFVSLGGLPQHVELIQAIEAVTATAPRLSAAPSEQPADTPPLAFYYTNYRGAYGTRRAIPLRVYYGTTDWHHEPQWLMEARDLDKDAVRVFAMRDMSPADTLARELADPLAHPLAGELKQWWCGQALLDDRLLTSGLVRSETYNLTDAGKAIIRAFIDATASEGGGSMTADVILRLNLYPWAWGAGRTGKTFWIDAGPVGVGLRIDLRPRLEAPHDR